ncbi:hypothetical protein C4O89_04320 [Mannheimia haemolytica]|uniref:cupin domain-containing protein n=1 Tax=Mannheimia haemolytica TaxID=75985 RepID=UPI000F70342F|nr:cupin domain-containing protein [Mannheimia haemolytica]AWW68616.1 hypothetical protein C4O89_04320 [Mannheimia haemolytica]
MKIQFPISYQEFRESYFEKKPLLMKGAISQKDLLSWKSINEILPRCDLISEDAIKVMHKGKRAHKKD